ncbi:hypothetical protein EVG20_g8069 [Dentipellis fragilis]|uniref:Rieske domain-containing protein n=1 Tax=Dentipellis fragilis TaxID=205917 RepID=A0A4Y9YB12_9AGAM|nr:hypothetical protein EVG20_g8069 [Dentipellis fragilis]
MADSNKAVKEYLQIAPYDQLLTHFRYFLNLRSQEGRYHSLILFRLASPLDGAIGSSSNTEDAPIESASKHKTSVHQLYAMESSCPHLGADMSHADIEEYESSAVAVCPWHRYDFDLKTGKSDTGLKACTYNVEVRQDPTDDVDRVWVEVPDEGTNWRLVELRPVSEAFADPPPPLSDVSQLALSESPKDEDVVPADNPPTTLMQWAVLILNTSNPTLKVERTKHAVHQFRTGQLKSIGHRSPNAPRPPDVPPRHDAYRKSTVDPAKAGRRKNRVAMLHALTNIEQWAIDLAWDIMARFGPTHPDLPPAFFSDFTKMALDESKHFSLLTSRMGVLASSTPYGSLPVHAALWSSARSTFPSLRARLAIIHLVHEARGLDVNPATIARFARAGDKDSVAALEIIHADEVTHVTTGHRWFSWICARDGVDPVTTFREEVRQGWSGDVKGPFNVEDREKAGMTRDFYEDLRGEMEWDEWERTMKVAEEDMRKEENTVGSVAVEYEGSKS